MNASKLSRLLPILAPLVVAATFSTGTRAQEPASLSAADELNYAQVFNSAALPSLAVLDEEAMRTTKGEVLPFIAAVATVDLALAGFFWGVYVPVYAAGGGSRCPACNITLPALR